MNKTKTVLLTAVLAVAIAFGASTLSLINKPAKTGDGQPGQTLGAQQNENEVTFTAIADQTVLDQLQTKANVSVKDSSYGPYVDSINGIAGGTDGKYWSYYVDGQLAQIGAGEYVTKGGEKIQWKFE